MTVDATHDDHESVLAPLDEDVDHGKMRFAFRHFPLTSLHPHARAAAVAAEASARPGRFRGMHGLLFHRQKALEDGYQGGSRSCPVRRGRRHRQFTRCRRREFAVRSLMMTA
jgi:hypothetical protein